VLIRKISLLTILLSTVVLNLFTSAQAEPNKKLILPFSAQYTVLHKSDPVGTAVRELSYQSDGSVNYHYETQVKWLIFSQERSETSILTVENNRVIPQHYTYTREGTGKDKRYEWLYNVAENKATDIERKREHTIDFSNNVQDKLSYHLQHRLNLINNAEQTNYVYPVISTSGVIKNYDYEFDGNEELMLPYGLVNTIRFKREVKEKERITYAWFAPELNYLLVKLYQIKAGNGQFEAQLSNYTLEAE
jgi:hypothetical protein